MTHKAQQRWRMPDGAGGPVLARLSKFFGRAGIKGALTILHKCNKRGMMLKDGFRFFMKRELVR